METKYCGKCQRTKSVCDFYVAKRKSDGLQSWCKKCVYANSKKDYAINKRKDQFAKRGKERVEKCRAFVNKVKKLGCRVCAENEPCCIDFHHLHSKLENISSLVRQKSNNKVIDELLKCQPLCSNCHRKAHNGLISLNIHTLTISELLSCGLKEFSPNWEPADNLV